MRKNLVTLLSLFFFTSFLCNAQNTVDKFYVYKSAMEAVKEKLTIPSTAIFPSELIFSDQVAYLPKYKVYMIQSYVDNQDKYGGKARSFWQALVEYNDYNTRVIDVILDGTSEQMFQRNFEFLQTQARGYVYNTPIQPKAQSVSVKKDHKEGAILRVTKPTSLREDAGSSHFVLRRLKDGDTVRLLKKTNKFWYEVVFDGDERGFVKAALLEESASNNVQ